MTGPALPSLMADGAYAPFILVGGDPRRGSGGAPFVSGHCYTLWAIERGTATVVSADQRLRLRSPAALLLAPGGAQAVTVPAGAASYRLWFDVVPVPRVRRPSGAMGHQRWTRQPPPRAVWGIDLPWAVPEPLVAPCLEAARFCCASWWRGDLWRARANVRLSTWLLDLVTHVAGAPEPGPRLADPRLARAAELARLRLERRVPVTELAAAAGLGRQRFTRLWTREVGRPPGAVLAEMRMERARALLLAGDEPVAEVARRCGFRSPATFAHRFRAATGTTPTAWRRAHRQGIGRASPPRR